MQRKKNCTYYFPSQNLGKREMDIQIRIGGECELVDVAGIFVFRHEVLVDTQRRTEFEGKNKADVQWKA